MTVQVDDRNRYFFGGKIEEETIKGWGSGLRRFLKRKLSLTSLTSIAFPS